MPANIEIKARVSDLARVRMLAERLSDTPPETIEARTLVSEATMPASTFPISGAPATCASSMPDSRPRIESGVTVRRMFERRTALT